MNRQEILQVMIAEVMTGVEKARKEAEELKAQSDELFQKAAIAEGLTAPWRDELESLFPTLQQARQLAMGKATEKVSVRRAPPGRQAQLQAEIQEIMAARGTTMKTEEVRREMGIRGHELSKNYTGTLLSRGAPFELLPGRVWRLASEVIETDEEATGEESAIERDISVLQFPDDENTA